MLFQFDRLGSLSPETAPQELRLSARSQSHSHGVRKLRSPGPGSRASSKGHSPSPRPGSRSSSKLSARNGSRSPGPSGPNSRSSSKLVLSARKMSSTSSALALNEKPGRSTERSSKPSRRTSRASRRSSRADSHASGISGVSEETNALNPKDRHMSAGVCAGLDLSIFEQRKSRPETPLPPQTPLSPLSQLMAVETRPLVDERRPSEAKSVKSSKSNKSRRPSDAKSDAKSVHSSGEDTPRSTTSTKSKPTKQLPAEPAQPPSTKSIFKAHMEAKAKEAFQKRNKGEGPAVSRAWQAICCRMSRLDLGGDKEEDAQLRDDERYLDVQFERQARLFENLEHEVKLQRMYQGHGGGDATVTIAENIFDFVIVVISLAETAVDLWAKAAATDGSSSIRLVRALRLARRSPVAGSGRNADSSVVGARGVEDVRRGRCPCECIWND
eukprot:g1815.t1